VCRASRGKHFQEKKFQQIKTASSYVSLYKLGLHTSAEKHKRPSSVLVRKKKVDAKLGTESFELFIFFFSYLEKLPRLVEQETGDEIVFRLVTLAQSAGLASAASKDQATDRGVQSSSLSPPLPSPLSSPLYPSKNSEIDPTSNCTNSISKNKNNLSLSVCLSVCLSLLILFGN
jgi:hypothetical protein